MNIHLLIAFASILFFGTVHTQPTVTKTSSECLPVNKEYPADSNPVKIKWTWQLPTPVRNAFNRSYHANWFIEKMIRYDSGGKTIYRLWLNNENLLDGDHYDSFLKNYYLDISDDGAILRDQSLY